MRERKEEDFLSGGDDDRMMVDFGPRWKDCYPEVLVFACSTSSCQFDTCDDLGEKWRLK